MGADVSFTFQYTIPSSGVVSVRVKSQAGTELVSQPYLSGNVFGEPYVRPRVNFTGDFTIGDWSFTLNTIQTSDIGLYTLISDDVTQSCVTLYVTGNVCVFVCVCLCLVLYVAFNNLSVISQR